MGGLLAGSTFALAGGGVAGAATGIFMFHHRPGDTQVFNKPVDDQCYDVGLADGAASNGTDRSAKLYGGPGCRGKAVTVMAPGESSQSVEFQSVKFTR
ncbi:hypothetical protein AB0L06_38995 [Spirillospora sp. NPDC052269]